MNNTDSIINSNVNNKINNYIFNKNKFSLKKPSESLFNKDLNYCKKYSIENNKAGFNFYGKNNKCYLYKSSKPTKKLIECIESLNSVQKVIFAWTIEEYGKDKSPFKENTKS